MFPINRLVWGITTLVLIGGLLTGSNGFAEQGDSIAGPGESERTIRGDVQVALRNRLESWVGFLAPERRSRESALPIQELYERRAFEPLWVENNRVTAQARAVEERLNEADRDGLRPAWYRVDFLRQLRTNLSGSTEPASQRVQRLVTYELMLTESLYRFSLHLHSGRLDPRTLDTQWIGEQRTIDLSSYLLEHHREGRLPEGIDDLAPSYEGYDSLRKELQKHRELRMDGAPDSPGSGPVIRPGDEHEDVMAVREWLARFNLPERNRPEGRTYDSDLVTAVETFQRNHGLEPDGVIGPRTREAMNRSLDERIRTIELNMERWRWLPRDLGNPHVLVNIAGFRTRVVRDGETVMSMRSVVGRPYRQTPVFSDRIRYLVFNPSWNVPHSIAVNDILPRIRENSDYLEEMNFRVYDGWGPNSLPVDPDRIDWSRMTARTFSYRFRQEPGPRNALGQVKFMFPNSFNVYLHDTPARELFGQTRRDFSSGCIRVEEPMRLAEFLLGRDWNQDRIQDVLDDRNERTVNLPDPVPVHMLYWTAWVDENGTLQWRDDIYDRDGPLAEAFYGSDVR